MKWSICHSDGTKVCDVTHLEYHGEWMGDDYVLCDIESPTLLTFAVGDYLIYRGERFEIYYETNVVKQSRSGSVGNAFEYNGLKLHGRAYRMTEVEFKDVVLNDNYQHYTSLPTFSAYCKTIEDLADRYAANALRAGLTWKFYTPDRSRSIARGCSGDTWDNLYSEGIVEARTEDVNVSVDKMNLFDAIGLSYSLFGLSYYHRDGATVIGSVESRVGDILSYGKGNGLASIERVIDENEMVATKLFAYGSDENLPSGYYGSIAGGAIPAGFAANRLMLPGFPTMALSTLARSRYVPALGRTAYEIRKDTSSMYQIFWNEAGDRPITFSNNPVDPYLVSGSSETYGIREGTVNFEDDDVENGISRIYPSLEGMTKGDIDGSSDRTRLDEIVGVVPETDPGTGEGLETTFVVYLRDLGFNLRKAVANGSSPKLVVKDGYCGGRSFGIRLVVARDGGGWEVTCDRVKDESLDRYFPNAYVGGATQPYQICAGDHFVIEGIYIEDTSYIFAASVKMLRESVKFLLANDHPRATYAPKIDEIYMAREQDENDGGLHDALHAGMPISFTDTDLNMDVTAYIDTLSITEDGNNGIPTYDVTLREDKVATRIDRLISSVDKVTSGQVSVHVTSGGTGGGTSQRIEVDSVLSATSTNPVQNKVVKAALDTKIETGSNTDGVLSVTKEGTNLKIDSNAWKFDTDTGDLYYNGKVVVNALQVLQNMQVNGTGNIDTLISRIATINTLTVTGAAHFFKLVIDELKSNEGAILITHANAEICSVNKSTGQNPKYTLYFQAEDDEGGAKLNSWQVGDQLICMSFDGVHSGYNGTISNQYYWGLVESVSSVTRNRTVNGKTVKCHWVLMSSNTMAANSTEPKVGDKIVQLGHRFDPTGMTEEEIAEHKDRQSAIIISSYRTPDTGVVPPSLAFYRDIDDYTLATHRKTYMDAKTNVFVGSLKVGNDVVDDLDAYIGERTKYVHIAYSNTNDPSTQPVLGQDWVKDNPGSGVWDYLGTCVDTNETSESLTFGDYEWLYTKGSTGSAGPGEEKIYKRFQNTQTWGSNNSNPAYWDADQTDNFLGPTGYKWSASQVAYTSTYKYVYVATRKKTNGVWGKFGTPVQCANYGAPGTPGAAGESYKPIAITRVVTATVADVAQGTPEQIVLALRYKVLHITGSSAVEMTQAQIQSANLSMTAHRQYLDGSIPSTGNSYSFTLNDDGSFSLSAQYDNVSGGTWDRDTLAGMLVELLESATRKESDFVELTLLAGASFSIANGLRSYVQDGFSTVNGEITRMNTAIEQNAQNITLKASQTDLNATNGELTSVTNRVGSLEVASDHISMRVSEQSRSNTNLLQRPSLLAGSEEDVYDWIEGVNNEGPWQRYWSSPSVEAGVMDHVWRYISGETYGGYGIAALSSYISFATGGNGGVGDAYQVVSGLNTGQSYTLSVYVKRRYTVGSSNVIGLFVSGASSINVSGCGYEGSHVTMGSPSGTGTMYVQFTVNSNDTDWHRLWIQFTASSTSVTPRFRAYGQSSTFCDWYVNRPMLNQGSVIAYSAGTTNMLSNHTLSNSTIVNSWSRYISAATYHNLGGTIANGTYSGNARSLMLSRAWNFEEYPDSCPTLLMAGSVLGLRRAENNLGMLALRQTLSADVSKMAAGGSMTLSIYVCHRNRFGSTTGFTLRASNCSGITKKGIDMTDTDVSNSPSQMTFDFNDSNWHRISITFGLTSAAQTSGFYVEFDVEGDHVNKLGDDWVVAMPKLEVGGSASVWSDYDAEKMDMGLREAGIDITARTVDVYGEHIHMEGVVTANNGFKIGLDGSMEANNGTFAGFVRTKPRVIQSITSDMLLAEDFVSQTVFDVNVQSGYPDCLLPWHALRTDSGDNQCVSIDLLKAGSHIVFYGNNMMNALVHLPFMYPHPNSVYAAFDCAYYKGIKGRTQPGVYPSNYPEHDSTLAWNTSCPELLNIKSYVGCEIEIANMTNGNISICGIMTTGAPIKGTLVVPSESINGSASLTPSLGIWQDLKSPWQRIILPTLGVLRATCVRETESGSALTDIERIYWRVDSYAQLTKKYTAEALGL